jgi:hypothetical protein
VRACVCVSVLSTSCLVDVGLLEAEFPGRDVESDDADAVLPPHAPLCPCLWPCPCPWSSGTSTTATSVNSACLLIATCTATVLGKSQVHIYPLRCASIAALLSLLSASTHSTAGSRSRALPASSSPFSPFSSPSPFVCVCVCVCVYVCVSPNTAATSSSLPSKHCMGLGSVA